MTYTGNLMVAINEVKSGTTWIDILDQDTGVLTTLIVDGKLRDYPMRKKK